MNGSTKDNIKFMDVFMLGDDEAIKEVMNLGITVDASCFEPCVGCGNGTHCYHVLHGVGICSEKCLKEVEEEENRIAAEKLVKPDWQPDFRSKEN